MATEREVKMGAAPGFHLPPLDDLGEAVTALPHEERRLETTYYDTPDLRLARWGCSLRHRQGEGWTLKLPGEEVGGALARPELEFAGGPRRPPAAALEMVTAYVRREKLVPVARLSTMRTSQKLSGPGGRLLAEVVDDEVSILQGRRVAARFRELEVELKAGGTALLDEVVWRLRAAGAGAPDPVPKYVRALGPAAQRPPEAHPAPIGPQPSAGEVVQAAIASSVQLLMRHDPGVRLGEDIEDVHQARVATRRLRSHLRLFEEMLDPTWAESLRADLSRLAGDLGAVRDGQVLAERLRGRAGDLPPEDDRRLRRLIAQLDAQVEAAVKELAAEIRSERYVDLLERLVQAAQSPPLSPAAAQPAAPAMADLANRAWRRLRRAVRALAAEPPDEDLHRVRILAKRARYAAEAAVPVFGKSAAAYAKAVAEVQTVLGEHQDSVTAQRWLREHATGSLAFVGGELHAIERTAAALSREEWPGAWRKALRKSLRGWMEAGSAKT